jgi:N-acetylglucosamine kinase-like BadF-type ATPase
MIAITDGGSTKCDWIILDDNGKKVLKTVTDGFNPNVIDAELIPAELEKNTELSKIKLEISDLFFYGAGCGIEKNCHIISTQFQKFFQNAKITVKDDMTAAAYATYNGKPEIVCILGTGSNSCFFDGKNIRKDFPSLGFLIGDEGSGNAIGKLLLKKFFMKKLPEDLHQEFISAYHLSIEDVLKNLYHHPKANAYLGNFNPFVAERKNHPYFQNMIFNEMKNFLDEHVLPYPEAQNAEINFIGNVACIYEDFLRAAAAELNLKIGTFVKKPIENLAEYHKNYIFHIST